MCIPTQNPSITLPAISKGIVNEGGTQPPPAMRLFPVMNPSPKTIIYYLNQNQQIKSNKTKYVENKEKLSIRM